MQIKPRQLTALALVLVAAALQFIKPAREARPPKPIVVAADQLQLGTLTLQPCSIGNPKQATLQAYCTEFSVPENHEDATSRSIKLKVAVVKSDAAQPDADLVTFLDGGPGGAATDDFPAIAAAFDPLLKQHHVLLVDQRGTGGSNALECPQITEREKGRAPAELDYANNPAQLQSLLRECLDEIGERADARYYSSSDAVQDLEALRIALGSPQLNLVGVSYGTRMAQQYATHYPTAVRSVVLDSAVPNTLALGQDHARNLETALQKQFATCTANPECAQRFTNPYAQLQALRTKLQAEPVQVQVADPYTFVAANRSLNAARLAGLVRLYAYNSATSALLPLMIDDATKGNYAPLLGQEQLISDDVSERMSGGMSLSVGCSEDADLLSSNAADAQTLLGNSIVEFFKTACEVWPHRTRPADFHDAFNSAVPVLILAGELDPVTPPRYADEIAKGLPNARVLLALGQGHAVLGTRCMPELIGQFIEKLQPKALDAKCLEQLKPTATFLNYNGAAP
ncbi:MAG: alpha/beta hydrolase [Steroidobacteraceae bacterium]